MAIPKIVPSENTLLSSNNMDSGSLKSGDSSTSYGAETSFSIEDGEEESVINILANVGDGAISSEDMVTEVEDSWVKTMAGIAGNILEW